MFEEEDAGQSEFMHTYRLDLDRRVLDRMQTGSAPPARHREMMSLQFLMG